ncbi:MAG: hypothetical protein C5B50_24185 [Verrucomicrobia bacterium]|nr:MAG: hypothetical protein C5B50_24185 [Verrucomicrobiota bacterium]
MIVLPVIARELRASARQPMTYYVRVLGAGAALGACLSFGMDQDFGPNMGGELFGTLHIFVFWAIWIFVPFLAADCISRERRESTLGLLFLTRLRGKDIVIAKGFAHGLRAATLSIAVLPIMAIPLLMGGVSLPVAALSTLINLSALCWALSAGLMASSWTKSRVGALMGAVLFAGLALILMVATTARLAFTVTPISLVNSSDLSFLEWCGETFALLGGNGIKEISSRMGSPNWPSGPLPIGFWRGFTPIKIPFGFIGHVSWMVSELAVFSLLALLLAIWLAGRKTRASWQEKPPSVARLWWAKTFCTPRLWTSLLNRWMQRKLQKNPIGWLEQRTWSGRLVTWGWLAVLISVYSAVLTYPHFFREEDQFHSAMAWMLAGSVALSAAGSFRRERDSGVMELLLVSPVNEWGIIFGRVRGLWAQFLPAFALLLGLWAYLSHLDYGVVGDHHSNSFVFFTSSFLCLPIIGLYYSLRFRNFMSAFISTLLVGLLLPQILPGLLAYILGMLLPGLDLTIPTYFHFTGTSVVVAFQLILTLKCLRSLHHRLQNRTFSFERTAR